MVGLSSHLVEICGFQVLGIENNNTEDILHDHIHTPLIFIVNISASSKLCQS